MSENEVLEEEVVDMNRRDFVNMDEWIEHRFAPGHAIGPGQQAPSAFRWTHQQGDVPQSVVQPQQTSVRARRDSGNVTDNNSQDDISSASEEPTRRVRSGRRTEHEQTVPTPEPEEIPVFIGGKSLFDDQGDSGEPLEEGGEGSVCAEEEPVREEGCFEVELPEADDYDESTLPYGGSVLEIQDRDILEMQAQGLWGSYVRRCLEMNDLGELKLIDPTRPATVLEEFRERAISPVGRDTCVSLMDGDIMNDEARVVILDMSADMNMKGWDVRTRFLWFYPGLEDYIWKMRCRPGTFFSVCGEITSGKLIYVLISRRRWIPQVGTKELDFFITLSEIFKEVRATVGEGEIAMTLPSIPSMGGRRSQIAQCVANAGSASGLCVRLYQSF
jgi:hypothetical protein